MQVKTRTLAEKFIAVGFILQILLGNYWLVHALMHKETPGWLVDAFLILTFWVFAWGLVHLVQRLRLKTAD